VFSQIRNRLGEFGKDGSETRALARKYFNANPQTHSYTAPAAHSPMGTPAPF
jgi:hypothetical protein